VIEKLNAGSRGGTLLSVAVVAVLWEVVGRLQLVGQGAFPSLSGIAAQLWRDRADYPQHTLATVQAAGIGFVIGNAVAIGLALVFVRVPLLERLLRGVGLTLFSVPLIALVPVLIIAFQGSTPRIVLAALSVYFPTMVSTLVGLRRIDPRLADVVRAAGGSERDVLWRIRLRAALPALFAGLRIAAPAALLGSMLVEFGGGFRWGLGSYLLGSLGSADPERIWGIGLVATAVAATAYGVFAWLGNRLARTSGGAETLSVGPEALEGGRREPWWRTALLATASGLVVVGLWTLVLRLLAISPVVAKTPLGVVRYLTSGSAAAEARTRLLDALGQTMPVTLLGLAAGLAAAFLLALLLSLLPALGRAFLPFALVSQTMPLPALTPLLVLVFGRGVLAIVMVTISVTFFPSFVTIVQGLTQAPAGPSDVVQAYGGSRLLVLRYVGLPNAVPYLLTAARLAAPRALLGVMIAEFLATGTGIGNLINQARGELDYGMIWAVAAVAVVVALALTQLVGLVERLTWRRFGI
jgi:ABC-type nitrate/sulfonate/bicarbonate transport system permease component